MDVDVLVIGGGVAGLACAARLARDGRQVVVLERHGGPGRETSSRNSGVVHAGLYYPPDSLKARLCVEGRRQLYRWCEERRVAHRKTGKLVVATAEDEIPALEALAERGRTNGAGALALWDRADLGRREPALRAVAALWSPESGLVDAHELMDSLLVEARTHGADVAWKTEVRGLERRGGQWQVDTVGPESEGFRATCRVVVNAAGLEADRVAALAGVDVDAAELRQHPCKGNYFALTSDAPRPRTPLLYPVPRPAGAGLGIHLTTDLGGRCIAGPDAVYVDRIDYRVDEGRAAAFAEAVARYLPGIGPEHLTPDYAGIRPKLQPPDGGFRDFVVEEGTALGTPAMIHLVGIESPGLTAALAIAGRVSGLVAGL